MTKRNRRHHSIKRRRRFSWGLVFVLGGLFASILISSVFFDDMSVSKYIAMLQRARQLEKDIRDLERQNADLRTDMFRIQHDPTRIEELAREHLGFVKKGDTVYQIVTDPYRAENGQETPSVGR